MDLNNSEIDSIPIRPKNIKNILIQKFFLTALLVTVIFFPTYAQDSQTDTKGNSTEAVSKTADPAQLTDEQLTELAKKKLKEEKDKKKKKKTKNEKLIEMALQILGGLGIFLLGMKFMSDGIQTVAGSSLRKMIKAVTDNRFMACGVGVLITMLVQSSSVTTVMAVGFVNSTIMELNQAIGIILGANIGTTITGWILVLKIGKYGLPMIGIATFVYLFSKRETAKYIAFAIIGVGMVFLGLELMKNGFKPMQEFDEFIEWFKKFEANDYIGVLKCALVGCILTVIVQSSSATLGITIALATVGVIEFKTAAALVLGENIGTTITAFLASLNATTNAKRAAYFHVAFNIIGVMWITLFFQPYIHLIEWIMSHFHSVTDISAVAIDSDGDLVRPDTKAAIAYVHTIFNVTNVIIFLPFTAIAAKLLTKYVPDRKGKKGGYKTQLDFHMLQSSFAAIEQSSFELEKMKEKTREMFLDLEKYSNKPKKPQKCAKRIFEAEEVMDEVQTEITEFLTEILSGTLSLEQTEEAKKQLLIADEYESVSDYLMRILKYYLKLEDFGLSLSPDQKSELDKLHKLVLKLYDKVNSNGDNDDTYYEEILEANSSLTSLIKQLRDRHWDRISVEKMPPLLSTTYKDILTSYRKIKNILVTIYETRQNIK